MESGILPFSNQINMKNTRSLYWNDALVTDSDHVELSNEFRIPLITVAEVLTQIRSTGEPTYSAYSGVVRARILKLAESLTFEPEAPLNPSEAPEGATGEPFPSAPVEEQSGDNPTEAESDNGRANPIKDEEGKTVVPIPPTKAEKKKTKMKEFYASSEKEAKAAKTKRLAAEKRKRDNAENGKQADPDGKHQPDPVVKHAVTSLMTAMTNSGGNFIITEEGICSINPANPPTLIDSYAVVQNVLNFRDMSEVIDDKSAWFLGSIICNLENYFGEDFEIGQVCEQTSVAYNTMYKAVTVFRAYEGKRFNLSFSHHAEAYFTKIDNASRNDILTMAEKMNLNCKQVRSLCNIAKHEDGPLTVKSLDSKQEAEDLIKAHKSQKIIYYIYDKDKDLWTRKIGTTDAIPVGTVVIDTKNHTARMNNGQPVKILRVLN
jgi:hypothetical protein